jgi:hypothetical protein
MVFLEEVKQKKKKKVKPRLNTRRPCFPFLSCKINSQFHIITYLRSVERFELCFRVPQTKKVFSSPHQFYICERSRGDGGIDKGVDGYWNPDSEQVVECSYECDRGGVCGILLGTAPALPDRSETYMGVRIVIVIVNLH